VLVLCLQGGGVSVREGTANINSCNIYSNSVSSGFGYGSYSGGGVLINGGSVDIVTCNIFGNQAGSVSARFLNIVP
jgi:hypothetical protein